MHKVELSKPVRFVQIGEVAIVLGKGATASDLEDAILTARALIEGSRTTPSPGASAAPFTALNNDEDGTDRGPQCTRCGRDAAGIWCQACFQDS